MKELVVWNLKYSQEVQVDGGEEIYEGECCNVLGTEDVKVAMGKVEKSLVGREVQAELTGEMEGQQLKYTITGIRFGESKIIADLTDLEE